jgi:hypothetical protein
MVRSPITPVDARSLAVCAFLPAEMGLGRPLLLGTHRSSFRRKKVHFGGTSHCYCESKASAIQTYFARDR